MIRSWLKKNVAAASSGLVIVLVAALVITVAAASGGYSTERTDLDNASVWVVNDAETALGRLNTQITQLDTATRSNQTGLTVIQNDLQVLLYSREKKELSIVDEALSSFDEKVQLPVEADDIFLAGKTLVVHASSTGQVWFIPTNALDGFTAETEPDLTLGKNSTVAGDDNGAFAAYSESSGLIRMDLATSTAPEAGSDVSLGEKDDSYQSAIVAGKAIILNTTAGTLSINGADPVALDSAESPVLMSSAPQAEDIYVSDSRGLIRVSLTGSNSDRVFSDASGVSARTTVVGNCVFAAWNDGSFWRDCAGKTFTQQLAGATGEPRLAFAVRFGYVVLNDEVTGRSWMVQKDGQLVNNWDDILQDIEDDDKQKENDPMLPAEVDSVQKPPVAQPDTFGARPGRTSTLPVLLNDFDPNGDVIMISDMTDYPSDMGTAAVISNGQFLQVSLPPDASGSFTFGYRISDGKGKDAGTTVTVQIRQPGENSPPIQARQTSQTVTSGDQFDRAVLSDWYDPDGDPIFLADAVTTAPDVATFSAKGIVYFQDSDSGSSNKSVALMVSDGAASTPGTLAVEVSTASAPIIADGIAATGHRDQEVTVQPLDYVRGGNGLIRVTGVPDDKLADATVAVNSETGEVRFTASKVGTYLLEYKVSDGSSAVSGSLRIDIFEPPAPDSVPITTPSSAFLYLTQTDTVNVLASDVDPAGGVLMISGMSNPLESEGLIVEVLNHGMMRASLSEPIPGGRVDVIYTVTNGYQTTQGVLTIIQIEPPAKEKPPVAVADRAKARVGEVIEIPVLDNDIHPDGKPITLRPDFAHDINKGGGLLFVSGTKLRYLAPDKPGEFYATYIVESPGGEIATAVVQISVRELDAETNSAPAPRTVTARAVQGQTIRIPIILNGIDNDGDSVTLSGTETAPQLGVATATGKDYIEYEAGPATTGTDVFYYSVTDSFGARGNGQIRVGVMPAAELTSNPIATTDLVTVRPGTEFVVKPLDNDSDPDGGILTIVDTEKSDELPATFTDDTVSISVPTKEGNYPLLYTIQNATGGQSSAWIQVSVRKDAPPTRPIVDDTVLNLTDISKDNERVAVDTWDNVFYAEGSIKNLTIGSVAGWDSNVQVTDKKLLSIQVTDKNQIIPFRVSVTDDPEVASYGFVWVPGRKSAIPERRTDAKPLTVPSGQKLTINLADQVIAAGGKTVRISDASTVKPNNSNGANTYRNDTTLEFVSEKGYWGPASIMFTATDGKPGEKGNEATITLPITVTPIDNKPPTLRGASFTLEPTGTRTLDLKDLTDYPYPDDYADLEWSLPAGSPKGLSASLSQSSLTVKMDNNTPLGETVPIAIGVKDKKSEVATASIAVSVVGSTKAKVQPQPDTVELRRGETKTVDVLANDLGPAELTPYTVVKVESQNQVAGVTASPSADNRTITVTAAADAAISTNLQLTYRVQDAANQKDRIVTGTVTVIVVDVPDAPGAPRYLKQDSFQNDGNLRLSFTPSASSNGKPIERYLLRSTDGAVNVDCGLDNSSCTVTAAQAGVGVKRSYMVIAVNSVGESVASPPGPPLRIDYVPEAPTNLTAVQPVASSELAPVNGGTLNISWSPSVTPHNGTPASEYLVVVTQEGGDVKYSNVTSGTSVQVPNLEATTHTVTVTAKNNLETDTYGAIAWKSATVSGAAAKKAPTMNPVSFTSGDGQLTASYPAAANGGIVPTYDVVWGGGASTCAAAKRGDSATSSTQRFNASTLANVSITAWNGWACATVTGQQQYWQKPSIPRAPSISRATEFTGALKNLLITAPTTAGVESYYYRVGNGTGVLIKPGETKEIAGTIGNSQNQISLRACATTDGNEAYCSGYGSASAGLPLNLTVTPNSASPLTCQVYADVSKPVINVVGPAEVRWSYVLRDGRVVTRAEGQTIPGSAISMIVWARYDGEDTPDALRLSVNCN
ncbi:Ig-like domain-containing protein [Klugiella xanthotipulae]|uniref:Cadherin domain-containing protein n=1 Tax=Klugiella xanthotipulae TaxID=244735 RepID=A0A543I4J1_9MICO|nr:Ig-like domain-containing protein [Klugiella xanthotipulae]TQM65522.1 hypothetical protein FB466_0326 [Klugiella xanthotipulae]